SDSPHSIGRKDRPSGCNKARLWVLRELSPGACCGRSLRWSSSRRSRDCRLLGSHQAQLLAQFRVDLLKHVGILAQELLGVFAALTDALAFVAVPGAAFLDQVVLHAQI